MLHREKMFVEANQLLSGLIPYKEVFIMYGYITTVLDAFSLIFFGKYEHILDKAANFISIEYECKIKNL